MARNGPRFLSTGEGVLHGGESLAGRAQAVAGLPDHFRPGLGEELLVGELGLKLVDVSPGDLELALARSFVGTTRRALWCGDVDLQPRDYKRSRGIAGQETEEVHRGQPGHRRATAIAVQQGG